MFSGYFGTNSALCEKTLYIFLCIALHYLPSVTFLSFSAFLGRNPAPEKHPQGSPSGKEAFIKAAERNLNDAAFNSTTPGEAAQFGWEAGGCEVRE